MEFFKNAKAVRLKSHLEKYLVADDDEQTVRQSRNGSSKKARWTVEFVEGNNHLVRLKSCHGRYLTASDHAFLLGMTGKKVLQTFSTGDDRNDGGLIEWEPIKEGYYEVKLRTKCGKFLRANGATPPWRNSVTHDLPNRTATQDWVLWEVDAVDISGLESEFSTTDLSPASSFSSFSCDIQSAIDRSPSIASEIRSPSAASHFPSGFASGRQNGMEFFDEAKAVRLQSHLRKYLIADDDEITVRQSRNGSSHKARWTVEFIDGRSNKIRLKSHYGRYLTAVDEPFLIAMAGKKVLQTLPTTITNDASTEWEPIKEGLKVKLRSSAGKFLRANGGSPPWRNSVTHDIPQRTTTQDWILWGVDMVDILITESESAESCLPTASRFSSVADDYNGSPDTGSPMAVFDWSSQAASQKQSSGMEFFQKAKYVRLRSHHEKYLLADEDEESVFQDRYGSTKQAKWLVEIVQGVTSVIRLRSCYDRYLTATDDAFLLGVTGRKVLQTVPGRLDSSVEWEPIREGFHVKLKTRYGNFLRANGGLPPWRNSITHDIPHRHQDWILWQVDVIEIRPESPEKIPRSVSVDSDLSSSPFQLRSPTLAKLESNEQFVGSPVKSDGRIIYYSVADDDGNVDDEAIDGPSFNFKGHNLEELTQKMEEETGLENIILCSRNPLNGKLYPLKLALPPNNSTMNIVVIPSTSKAARDFVPETTNLR